MYLKYSLSICKHKVYGTLDLMSNVGARRNMSTGGAKKNTYECLGGAKAKKIHVSPPKQILHDLVKRWGGMVPSD